VLVYTGNRYRLVFRLPKANISRDVLKIFEKNFVHICVSLLRSFSGFVVIIGLKHVYGTALIQRLQILASLQMGIFNSFTINSLKWAIFLGFSSNNSNSSPGLCLQLGLSLTKNDASHAQVNFPFFLRFADYPA
jgi:hypothetical protein